MATIYKLLNDDAKTWWYHKQLRDHGKHAEARELERKSIKSHVKTLRNAHHATIGRGGWTIAEKPVQTAPGCSSEARLQHYGGIDEPMLQCALKIGIPIIDSTTIPEADIRQVIKFPLIAVREPEPAPYNSLSRAPVEYVANLYRELGATLYNFA